MPHIDKHPPGSFAWLELGTTDRSAAKQFYGALFGWQAQEYPNGPAHLFLLEGKYVAGCYSIAQYTPGAPPNWGIYVAVQDADEAARHAADLGGTILRPVSDVDNLGRMAVIQDPAGAVFRVWQTKTEIGAGITGVEGTLCWADLNTPARDQAKTFYERLFGWRLTPGKGKDPSTYLHIQNGEAYIGGILPDDYRNQQAPPHWLAYFLVKDCEGSTAKAKELGAKVYMPLTSIEGGLRYSVLADPQGAVFALFQPGSPQPES